MTFSNVSWARKIELGLELSDRMLAKHVQKSSESITKKEKVGEGV